MDSTGASGEVSRSDGVPTDSAVMRARSSQGLPADGSPRDSSR